MEIPSITVAAYVYDWAQRVPGLAVLTPNVPYTLSGAAPPTPTPISTAAARRGLPFARCSAVGPDLSTYWSSGRRVGWERK